MQTILQATQRAAVFELHLGHNSKRLTAGSIDAGDVSRHRDAISHYGPPWPLLCTESLGLDREKTGNRRLGSARKAIIPDIYYTTVGVCRPSSILVLIGRIEPSECVIYRDEIL